MITIKHAFHRHGYSGNDHCLNDEELEPIIGRKYRSVRDARLAAERLSTGTSGRADVPICLEVLFADGTTRRFSDG